MRTPTVHQPPAKPAEEHHHRVGAALRHLLHRRRPVALPPWEEQVRALAEILQAAAAAQPAAEQVIAACGASGEVSGEVGQIGGRQLNIYQRLGTRLAELRVGDELAPLREHAMRLVAYHRWMLHEAMKLAFTPHHDVRAEAMRLRLTGLGAPANDLRALRGEVRSLAERGRPDGR
ncbi:hypothetical protein ACIQWA_06915 [Kitasatospora sp. NPDC098652]|uniref:hypothetical protein n=1 Tax=Kitasatospora sp. NPDC098652 TaxID=3364095 RepID=UPI0038265DA0